MGGQAIVERILSDAQGEAQAIISDAEQKAAAIMAEAETRAERRRVGTQAEIKDRTERIMQGKAATARLDSAKILLAEKRRVIDVVYARALESLLKLGKDETLKLAENLLLDYAEDGDEIVFAANFPYAQDVASLSAVKEKHLKVSPKTADIDGGFILIGKQADKDISYGALLALDREERQAEIAMRIF